jgi:hypothetical protein
MAAELVDRLAFVAAVRPFPGMGAADSGFILVVG